jgi:hypothetical protein
VGLRTGLVGYGKFVSTVIRSPDRPARSESLYRLRYLGPQDYPDIIIIIIIIITIYESYLSLLNKNAVDNFVFHFLQHLLFIMFLSTGCNG